MDGWMDGNPFAGGGAKDVSFALYPGIHARGLGNGFEARDWD